MAIDAYRYLLQEGDSPSSIVLAGTVGRRHGFRVPMAIRNAGQFPAGSLRGDVALGGLVAVRLVGDCRTPKNDARCPGSCCSSARGTI